MHFSLNLSTSRYDRIIRNPTQGLSHQFDMFRDFVKEHNPKDMLDVDEFLAMRKEVLAELSKDGEKKVRFKLAPK